MEEARIAEARRGWGGESSIENGDIGDNTSSTRVRASVQEVGSLAKVVATLDAVKRGD